MDTNYFEGKQLNMPAIETEWHEKWNQGHYFEQSINLRAGSPSFVFYEGPPSANGLPGIHHVIARTLKDMVCRYKTMQGFQVKRKAGWDTHGLPVELGVEKMLGITKEDIGKKISVEEYNKACRAEVMRYKDKWDDLTTKMGYWVDLKDPYVTFENNYIETLWWALKNLFDRGLLYKSVSIQPYSPAAGTGLSSHELNQPGTYRDVKDTTATVLFTVKNDDARATNLFASAKGAPVYFMAWTTTPWTLPSNAALTVGPKIEYALVQTFNPYSHQLQNVIIAVPLLHNYLKPEGENVDLATYKPEDKIIPWNILGTFNGKELEGIRYEQLLPFEANKPATSGGDPFRVIIGDFVTTEDGTGIVHTAPAYGADDYKVGMKNNIGLFNLVDRTGKFITGTGEFSGRYVKDYKDDPNYVDVNVDIAVKLKQAGHAFKVEKHVHSYPHCWRTDKPVIYYPLDAWFIKTTALKDKMVERNKTINWKPKATGEGRFGNWLENMVDWNLSRSRFWGTPLPVWRSETDELKCIGSIEELKTEIQKSMDAGIMPPDLDIEKLTIDLHKPYVDNIILVSETGKPMQRESDLIDVWFDSGAMPYAQWHFPFENKEVFANNYPADFIAEGVDQTRGWFYTLHALASLLQEDVIAELKAAGIEADETKFSGIAYKNVIANGLVLDKNGNKMSKRLGNAIDPFETIDKYSADATRWYLLTNAAPWESLKFDIEGIKEVQRKFFGTLYNTYQFFVLYANLDGFDFSQPLISINQRPEIDRWILSSLNTLKKNVVQFMNDYEPTQAGRAIEEFLDEHLSNWYVRLCRRRFWKGELGEDKISAYQTLYQCLETLSQLIAPMSPFFADWLFNNLNAVTHRFTVASVHHSDFPTVDESAIDTDLEERMQLAQDLSSLILSIRKKVNIKVRQPLNKVMIPVSGAHMQHQIERIHDLILSEVNVKEIEFLAPSSNVIHKKAKPNFKVLGKKVGGLMKQVANVIQEFDAAAIAKFEKQGNYAIMVEGTEVHLNHEDVDIIAEDIPGWAVANKDNLTVALDVTITPDLKNEGNARELVNKIQKIRKDNGFELTDRIAVSIEAYDPLEETLTLFGNYIKEETLADNIEFANDIIDGIEIDIDETKLKVNVSKSTL